MSTSAYRIEIRIIDGRVWTSACSAPTFNCYKDLDVKTFLEDRAVNDQLTYEGTGRFTIHIDSLKELFSEVSEGRLKVSEEVLKRLKLDFESAVESDSLSIEYEVF